MKHCPITRHMKQNVTDHSIGEKMQFSFVMLVRGLMLFLIGIIIICCFSSWEAADFVYANSRKIERAVALVAGASLLLLAITCLIYSMERRTSKKKHLFFCIFFLLLLMIQFTMIFVLKTNMRWDQAKVYEGAVAILMGEEPQTVYLSHYPHQYGIVFTLAFFLKLIQAAGIAERHWQLALQIFQIVIMDAGILISASLLEKMHHKSEKREGQGKVQGKETRTMIFVVLCFLDPTLWLWPGFIYSTVMSMTPFVIVLYLEILLLEDHGVIRNLLYFSLLAMMLFLGYKIRPTVLISMIAFGIIAGLWLRRDWIKNHWKQLILLLLVGAALFTGLLALEGKLVEKVSPNRDVSLEYPLSLWVMIGLTENGKHSNEDELLISSFSNRQEKESAIYHTIRERITRRGVWGMASLYKRKLSSLWSDSMNGSVELLGYSDSEGRWKDRLFFDHNDFFVFYSQSFNLLCFGCVFWGIFRKLNGQYKKKVDREANSVFAGSSFEGKAELLLELTFLGIILFQLIWETADHYSVSVEFLKLLLAAEGVGEWLRYEEHMKPVGRFFCLTAAGSLLFCTAIWLAAKIPVFTQNLTAFDTVVASQTMDLGEISLDEAGVIEQTFTVEKDFDYVSCKVKNYLLDRNSNTYGFILLDESKNEIFSTELEGRMLPCISVIEQKFPMVEVEKKEVFTLQMKALGTGKGDLFLKVFDIGHFDPYRSGELKIAGESSRADLEFMVKRHQSLPYTSKSAYMSFLVIWSTLMGAVFIAAGRAFKKIK